ncbi:MAG: phosphotransferase [Flavobacteriales bacterium]|nr:phosphotransferase [Flavobacteriales bacterium]
MATHKIHLSDISHLISLFTQEKTAPHIFDPAGRLIEDQPEDFFSKESEQSVLVNLAGRLNRFKKYSLDEFDFIIDFGKAQVSSAWFVDHYHVLNNPGGKMRWLYRANNLKGVLVFYNDAGWRGKLVSYGLKILSFLNLGRWIANEHVTIYSKHKSPLVRLLKHPEKIDSIFMGTPGVQQAALCSLKENGTLRRFVKIPLTQESSELLQNEKEALVRLTDKSLEYISIPAIENRLDRSVLVQESLKAKRRTHVAAFTELHASALKELHQLSVNSKSLNQCSFWEQIQASLIRIKPSKTELKQILKLCGELSSFVDVSKSVSLSMCHGDFTPWNMLLDRDRLYLYDWELSYSEAPALFDFFHFHYQRGILMDHVSYKTISTELSTSIELSSIQSILKDENIEFGLLHVLYLLRVATYFVEVYDRQTLTIQNNWQLVCWEQAIRAEIKKARAKQVGSRISFLREFNQHMSTVPHAFLKFDYDSLEELPISSDIDLAVHKEDITGIISFIQNHTLVDRVRLNKKSFMLNAEIFFLGGGFLSIDLIHRLQRKSITMLPIHELISSSRKSKRGVNVPELKYDLAYTYLFYTLNHAAMPLRYYRLFDQASVVEKEEALTYIFDRFSLKFNGLSSLFTNGMESRPILMRVLIKRGVKDRLRENLNYLLDTIRGFVSPTGFMITFSGVDGVGKSTVLKLVEEKLQNQFRKEVVLMRHRPGILPILSALKHGRKKAEQIASVTIPRKGRNRNRLSSVLRFAYYYSDYLFGQVYVYFKYITRGKVVLYDRYYFDFINDSKRSNICINRRIVKYLYTFILKPRLNIFLYTDPHIILSRKQELDKEDIVELSENYFALFKELEDKSIRQKYTAIENLELRTTIAEIIEAYQEVA